MGLLAIFLWLTVIFGGPIGILTCLPAIYATILWARRKDKSKKIR